MNLQDYLNKEKQPKRNFITIIVVLVLLVLCAIMMNRIEKRFVLSIDSIRFNNKTIFTVGSGSDLAFKTVPHDYMTIQHQDGGFTWEINSSRDSLCYFQINGKNPNTYPLSNESRIHIENVGEDKLSLDYTGEQIMDCVKRFEDTEYSLLRNILTLLGDSTTRQVMDDHSLASLVVKSKKTGSVSLIVLDKHTTVDDNGYSFNGSTEMLTPDTKDFCKIQFFAVKEMSVKYPEVETDEFYIGDLNYIVKPVLRTTEWGAGHIMLKPCDSSSMDIKFPEGLMFVERMDSLHKLAKLQSGLITIKQFNNTPPVANNIYLPTFSGATNSDICYLHFNNDELQIESNNGELLKVDSHFHFVPTLKRTSFSSVSYVINCRYGFLDWKYTLSYFFAPLAIMILILLTFAWGYKLNNHSFKHSSFFAKIFPSYFIAITAIAFTYCVGKTMIALKLSYTYPYFEKLTGIITVATSLFLLLFYLISLILNFDFVRDLALQQKKAVWKSILLFAPFIIGVFGMGFSFFVLHILDKGINADVHSSYFAHEWFTPNVLHWAEKAGINDTHRSVVYMLFSSCLIATGLLFLQAVISFSKKLREFRFLDKLDEWTTIKWNREKPNKYCVVNVLVYLLKYVLPIVILLLIIGKIPGNFSTAFITAISIWGLARSLTSIDPREGAIANILEMVLSSLIIITFASVPDQGYVTNYFGFFAAVVAFYILMQKSILSTALSKKERDRRKKEDKWIPRLGVGLAIILFCLPFIYNICKDPEKVDYRRISRRFMMTSQFEQYRESGYRYADSDVEFMKIMFHYMSSSDGSDPLSNEKHQLHPSVSTGQSPVILNDLSLPGAFVSPYGWGANIVYFVLLILLFYIVMTYSLTGTVNGMVTVFDRFTQWRLLAMLMWLGTSLYLFLSYCGILPFTGRLNPGFGVDSVGESLESAILLAVMTATTLKINDKN